MKFAACSRLRINQPRLPKRQGGIALITAVLVVAIAAIVATSMMSRQNFDTLRTANIIHRDQAIAYALGAEYWAGIELGKDARANNIDHLQEGWAYQLSPLPIEGGYLNGAIQDLQGRFNLNSILDPLQADRFYRLCQAVNVEPDFIPALQDWIDGDTEVRDNGAEDETYTVMDPPYRTANHFLTETSELLLVKGVSVQDYNSLMLYISAFPGDGYINVNTASPQLLQSLTRDVSPADAESIIGRRNGTPYPDIDPFVEEEVFAGKEISEEGLTVTSQYFLLTVDVMLGDSTLTLQSVLYRTAEGRITVKQRRFGPSRERILAENYNL